MDIIHQNEMKRDISPILLFALTLFSSASLMFVLQPMFGKALLPLLGGSASVWNTCMVFYQSILFCGYLYAHLLATRLGLRKHLLIHASLLILSLSFLPVAIPEDSRPPTAENPTWWLLTTLCASIGIPFFVLSTTSPLLQKWFSRIGHDTSSDPYYLSVASNGGSLLALLSYPLLVETSLGIVRQQRFWSMGFLVLTGMIATCMMCLKKLHSRNGQTTPASVRRLTHAPDIKSHLQWLLLAFVPSSLLLGTTHYISIDIATVPLLWVIPLALYLLTFILVFSRYGKRLYKIFYLAQPWIVTAFFLYFFSGQKLASFTLELFFHLSVFFISVMVCHGELAKNRPAAEYLTQYYLIMSFGGMLGGAFNSFIAPLIFDSIYEYPLMIVGALLLNPIHKRLPLSRLLGKIIFCIYLTTVIVILTPNIRQPLETTLICLAAFMALAAVYYFFRQTALYLPLIGLLVVSCATQNNQHGDHLLHQSRNFYGVLSVKKLIDTDTGSIVHEIYSGTTKHGLQRIGDLHQQCTPNGYYSSAGPLGTLFSAYNGVNEHWRVGVIGLGAGEMAAYAKTSQHWTFFELNPAVAKLATDNAYFTFLNECITNRDIRLGDARITLEQQPQRYDLLVVDAFTSDSIPTHLLTREAVELYFSRLNAHGLLVFHISNRYLTLKKVLADHAEVLGLAMRLQEFRPEHASPWVYRSDWAILARNPADLQALNETAWQAPPQFNGMRSWTDDFTSLVSVWKPQ